MASPERVEHGHLDGHEQRMRLAQLQKSRRHEAVLIGQYFSPHSGSRLIHRKTNALIATRAYVTTGVRRVGLSSWKGMNIGLSKSGNVAGELSPF